MPRSVLRREGLPRHVGRGHRRRRRDVAGHALPVLREQGRDLRRAAVRERHDADPHHARARPARARCRRATTTSRAWVRDWTRNFDRFAPLFVEWTNVVAPNSPLRPELLAFTNGYAKKVGRVLAGERAGATARPRPRPSWRWRCSPASTTSATSTARPHRAGVPQQHHGRAPAAPVPRHTGRGARRPTRSRADEAGPDVAPPPITRMGPLATLPAARLDRATRPVRRAQRAGRPHGPAPARLGRQGVRRQRVRGVEHRPGGRRGRARPRHVLPVLLRASSS